MAASTPKSMPRPTVKMSATTPISALTVASRMTSGVILLPRFAIDSPRSPCSTSFVMKSRYCTSSGRSRPYWWSSAASWLGRRRSETNALPGSRWMPMNTIDDTASAVKATSTSRLARYHTVPRVTPPSPQSPSSAAGMDRGMPGVVGHPPAHVPTSPLVLQDLDLVPVVVCEGVRARPLHVRLDHEGADRVVERDVGH